MTVLSFSLSLSLSLSLRSSIVYFVNSVSMKLDNSRSKMSIPVQSQSHVLPSSSVGDTAIDGLLSLTESDFTKVFSHAYPEGIEMEEDYPVESCEISGGGDDEFALSDCNREFQCLMLKSTGAVEETGGGVVFDRRQFGKLVELLLWARNQLVVHNLRLVSSIVLRYSARAFGSKSVWLDKIDNLNDELYQEGILGLIRAAEKYDARTLNRFSTYATFWIHSFVRRAQYRENYGDQLGELLVVEVARGQQSEVEE